MNYEEKLAIANEYLSDKCAISWDELGDTNSLHDADTKEEIIELCNERLESDGFPMELIE